MNTTLDGHARRQAARRAEILAVATKVFLEEGYGRATMDKVHAEIGGSKRTLYNHFPSKEDLFAAIVTNVSDRVLASLRPPLDVGDIRETLVTMGVSYLSVLVSPDGLALYRAMISEAPHFPELARTFFANEPGRASGHLSDFFREQKKLGVLKVDDGPAQTPRVSCRSPCCWQTQPYPISLLACASTWPSGTTHSKPTPWYGDPQGSQQLSSRIYHPSVDSSLLHA